MREERQGLAFGAPMTGAADPLMAREKRSAHLIDDLARMEVFSPLDLAAPWSANSLNGLEGGMLERWASLDDLPDAVVEQYEMFLGEGLRRLFGGSWVRLEASLVEGAVLGVGGEERGSTGWGIDYGDDRGIDVVSSLLPTAFHLRTGTWWSSTFEVTASLPRRG